MEHDVDFFTRLVAPRRRDEGGPLGKDSLKRLLDTLHPTGEVTSPVDLGVTDAGSRSLAGVSDSARKMQDIRSGGGPWARKPGIMEPRVTTEGPLFPPEDINPAPQPDMLAQNRMRHQEFQQPPVAPRSEGVSVSEIVEKATELFQVGRAIAGSAVHRARQKFIVRLAETKQSIEENFPELQSPEVMAVRETISKIVADTNEGLKKPLVSVRDTEVNRRQFLVGGTATAIAASFANSEINKMTEPLGKSMGSTLSAEVPGSQEQVLLPELGPKVYDMGKLAGKGAGGLTALYLNMKLEKVVKNGKTVKIPRLIKEQETIHFTGGVGDIWDAKVGVVQKKKPEWVNNTKRAKAVFEKIYETQQHKNEFLSLEQLTDRMDAGIRDVNQILDWKSLNTLSFNEVKFTNLTESDVELVKRLSEKIDGTMLMAYVMTEIMPSLDDHEFNMNVLDFLAQNAGSLYLIVLAAMGDPYLSNGPFQFTSFAVYDMGSKDKRGASAINMLLPKEKRIGGSVLALQTIDDHIKAGQLFAVYNIAAFLSGLRRNKDTSLKAEQLIDTLWSNLDTLDDDVILKYISAAHHLPGNARKAFKKLLENKFQKDFLDFADKGIKTYAKKSAGGHGAIKKRLGR